ncbi:MAG: hypothetical protein A3F43_04940 [Gammaproteobacteria bacterium RIFCSPHIGHO2_12_FULL_42_10]|nr:MAG: hypothetical protein A3F43_04940 [Gammaproteobacteria bacterium RIFCSPHIGHO2_12_FULL_42_10]
MKRKALLHNKIVVKKSKLHGYGVFADKNIRKGEKLEQCYVIVSKGGDDGLEDYYFDVPGRKRYALLTGFGIIYNHAESPNADYTINVTKRVATIKATENIKKGHEIYISYGDDWFKSRGLKSKTLINL